MHIPVCDATTPSDIKGIIGFSQHDKLYVEPIEVRGGGGRRAHRTPGLVRSASGETGPDRGRAPGGVGVGVGVGSATSFPGRIPKKRSQPTILVGQNSGSDSVLGSPSGDCTSALDTGEQSPAAVVAEVEPPRRVRAIIDDDDDEEEEQSPAAVVAEVEPSRRVRAIIDDDDEEEEEQSPAAVVAEVELSADFDGDTSFTDLTDCPPEPEPEPEYQSELVDVDSSAVGGGFGVGGDVGVGISSSPAASAVPRSSIGASEIILSPRLSPVALTGSRGTRSRNWNTVVC